MTKHIFGCYSCTVCCFKMPGYNFALFFSRIDILKGYVKVDGDCITNAVSNIPKFKFQI